MKFVSWNVNGLRACMNKGFLDTFYDLNADFFCLQETKLQECQIQLDLPGYEQYWCYAEKKGYSGTAIFTKHTPQSVRYGLGVAELDTEGRLITLEYPEFFLVTCYTPNAQRGLARIEHRLKWEDAFRAYLKELDSQKPVILCGDLNVAHQEIDLKNPGSNRGNAGFSDEERNAFSQLLQSGFTDSFRHLYPDKTGAYSWWSYMFNARANNAGWRIDYFVVSDRLADAIHDATIHPDYLGSDHCPVGLDLDITCNGGIWSPETSRPDDPAHKEADGKSSVGPFIRCGIAAVLIFATLGSVWLMTKPGPSPSPTETEPTSTNESEPMQRPIVKEVIDRSGTIETIILNSDITSSTMQEAFYNGTERWVLTEPTFSPFIPNNFYIQLVFDESYLFSNRSDLLKPEVNVAFLDHPDNDYIAYVYYYGANDTIAGCFLYGRTERARTVYVTVTYENPLSSAYHAEISQKLVINIAGDLSYDDDLILIPT